MAAGLRARELLGTYGLVTGAWVLVASEGAFALGSLSIVCRVLPPRRAAGWVAAWALATGGAVVATCIALRSRSWT